MSSTTLESGQVRTHWLCLKAGLSILLLSLSLRSRNFDILTWTFLVLSY